MHQALYRKWRPRNFDEVSGQEQVTSVLRYECETGHFSHAYLFCGSRGTGKTSCAKILAKAVNCEHPTSAGPWGGCADCRSIDSGAATDVLEMDAASNNGVDDIRDIRDEVIYTPSELKYRVYIIDEVHMLSTAAFNAFLKTLEEPPSYAIFIMATTEKHKVLPTILSRCQIYDFNRIGINDVVKQLQMIAEKEGIKTEPEGLSIIAQKADGAMRDALSIFDQVTVCSGGDVSYKNVIENLNVLDYDYYFKLVENFNQGNITDALLTFNSILSKGFDAQHFVSGLSSHLRNLFPITYSPSPDQ